MTFLLDQGIDQFLDIGLGIATAGNVHKIVPTVRPAASVVYVDIDPLAVAHSNLVFKLDATGISLATQMAARKCG